MPTTWLEVIVASGVPRYGGVTIRIKRFDPGAGAPGVEIQAGQSAGVILTASDVRDLISALQSATSIVEQAAARE